MYYTFCSPNNTLEITHSMVYGALSVSAIFGHFQAYAAKLIGKNSLLT